MNKGRFYNNCEIEALISKRLYVDNKAKLSQLETQNTSPAVLFIYNSSRKSFVLFSIDNRFEISVSYSLSLQNLPLLVERVSLFSLQIIALK